MTSEGRRETSAQEIAQARDELEASRRMLEAELFGQSARSNYYAVFHAARALLYSKGIEPKTHAGVIHLFGEHFVKTGLFTPEAGKLLRDLQAYRESADYLTGFTEDESVVRRGLAESQGFVAQVEKLLPTLAP